MDPKCAVFAQEEVVLTYSDALREEDYRSLAKLVGMSVHLQPFKFWGKLGRPTGYQKSDIKFIDSNGLIFHNTKYREIFVQSDSGQVLGIVSSAYQVYKTVINENSKQLQRNGSRSFPLHFQLIPILQT